MIILIVTFPLEAKPVISCRVNRAQELEEPLNCTLSCACIVRLKFGRLSLLTSSTVVQRMKEERRRRSTNFVGLTLEFKELMALTLGSHILRKLYYIKSNKKIT